jgi:TonB family protein
MRRLVAGIVFALMALAPTAIAQTDPVLDHYRAYRAAYDSGDIEAAEHAAEAALSASEARDGAGGRTAVLAENLAVVRLMRDDPAALAPAQRAFELAQSGAQGLDPLYAALVLGRAELRMDNPAGADRLRSVLQSPQLSTLIEADLYRAASELGSWSFAQRDYATAELAWSVAAGHAGASELGERFSYGVARTWQGAAIMFDEIGPHGRRLIAQDRGSEAYLMLADAVQALEDTGNARPSDGAITIGLRAYAEAVALHRILWTKLRADHRRIPETPSAEGDVDGFFELAGPAALSPRCTLRGRYSPRPEYPDDVNAGAIGAVILLMRIDETGETTGTEVVTRVGDDAFAEAVTRVAGHWGAEPLEGQPLSCRMPRTVVVPIIFGVP